MYPFTPILTDNKGLGFSNMKTMGGDAQKCFVSKELACMLGDNQCSLVTTTHDTKESTTYHYG